MTIQPWDSLCQAMGTFNFAALAVLGNGEGFTGVEYVAEGEGIIALSNPIDVAPPDPSMLVVTSPGGINNTIEVAIVDETHLRVRLRNPATAALRAGSFTIMVFNRPLPPIPAT